MTPTLSRLIEALDVAESCDCKECYGPQCKKEMDLLALTVHELPKVAEEVERLETKYGWLEREHMEVSIALNVAHKSVRDPLATYVTKLQRELAEARHELFLIKNAGCEHGVSCLKCKDEVKNER